MPPKGTSLGTTCSSFQCRSDVQTSAGSMREVLACFMAGRGGCLRSDVWVVHAALYFQEMICILSILRCFKKPDIVIVLYVGVT